MTTRAKFFVTERTELNNGPEPIFRINLSPVTCGSKENESFFKWTPGGSVVLQTINAKSAEQFKPGKEFYLDFTPVE